jgi:hypothetical protein
MKKINQKAKRPHSPVLPSATPAFLSRCQSVDSNYSLLQRHNSPPILVPQNVIGLYFINSSAAGMTQSAWQVAAACSVMGSNPDRADIFYTCPDRPRTPARGVHGVFRGNIAAGSWRQRPTTSRLKKVGLLDSLVSYLDT